jgi:hypothetical protein
MMSIKNRWMLAVLLFAGIMGTNALGKTKLIQSWADPSAPNYRFTKMIVIAMIEHAETRRTAEATIAKHIKRAKAIPSCTVLQKDEERDVEKTKQRLLKEGFDGVVVLRLYVAGEKVQYAAPNLPSYYWNYTSYSNYAMPMVTSGYVKYDRIVQVETLFYSLTDDKLLWSGISETKNPEDVSTAVDAIAKVIEKEFKKKGIIK